MRENIINKIKNNLKVLIEKKSKTHAENNHKFNDLIYEDNIKAAYQALYEFDENIFNESIVEALKTIDISDYFKRHYDENQGLTSHRKIGLKNLEDQNWLNLDFKEYIEKLLNDNNIEGVNSLHDIIYNSIEFNTIDIYFRKILEKNDINYQHLDNDISQASASIDKLKSASNFLLDKMGTLPLKDILQIDSELIDVIVETFTKQTFLNDLTKMLGKVSDSSKRKTFLENVKEVNKVNKKDNKYNPTKINGIKTGNIISSIVPYQLAYRQDELTKKIFNSNLLENKLLIFDQKDRSKKIIHDDKSPLKKADDSFGGAFIICIDTSYSMQHFGDKYAKAFVLLMLIEAKRLNRKVYIINFSDILDIYEIEDYETQFDLVVKFIKKSFYAGTNLDLALQKSLEIIQRNAYKKSDVIVISDFDVKSINKQLYNNLNLLKKKYGTLLYAFVISRMPRTAFVEDYYDEKFLFNGTDKSIENIHYRIKELLTKYDVK
ncbi:vWA domain-containing protein [Malacoplasma muris]|uniref:vWA domain-containing protein n=1 Tax=Malacoplasma muris TaxID=2119 RepID=UPI00398ED9DD